MIQRIFSNPEEVSRALADWISQTAARAVAERDLFSMALCGGGTPRRLYELLASEPWSSAIAWDRLCIYWGDERCVPPDHPESNYRQAREAFLDRVGLCDEQIHRIRGELAPEEAASDYARILGRPWPQIDLVLLGLGADGHTASLFPHARQGSPDAAAWAVEAEYEGRPAWRVTLNPALMSEARQVVFLVTGEGKREALAGTLGELDPDRWPAQRIRPRRGELAFWVDRAAGEELADGLLI